MNLKMRQYAVHERAYAEALLRAAQTYVTSGQGTLVEIQEDARSLLQVFKHSHRLLVFLESPHVKISDKVKLLDKVFAGKLHPLLLRLVHMLAERRRSTSLDEVLSLFLERINEISGIFYAVIATAFNLSDNDKTKLKEAMEHYTGHKLDIDFRVEPGIIGGVVFRSGDLLIDGSIRNSIDALRHQLLEQQIV